MVKACLVQTEFFFLYVFSLRVTQCCLTPNENISAELCQGTWWWQRLMRWWWSLFLTRLNRLDWILKFQFSETTVHRKIHPPTFTQAYYPDSDPISLYSTHTQAYYPDSDPTSLYSTHTQVCYPDSRANPSLFYPA